MHLVFECAALQMLRDDLLTLFQGVRSMRCFVYTTRVAAQHGAHVQIFA